MGINAIVTNIIAALLYDAGKMVATGTHTHSQEEELERDLNRFLKDQMERYGEDGEAIIEAIPIPKQTGYLYQNVVDSCANRDVLLQQWMQGCKDENYDRIRATCSGCIDIIIVHIKKWPEFMTDIAISTRVAVSKLSHNMEAAQSIMSCLTAESTSVQNTPDISDRTSEYAERWSEPLFLNNRIATFSVMSLNPLMIESIRLWKNWQNAVAI